MLFLFMRTDRLTDTQVFPDFLGQTSFTSFNLVLFHRLDSSFIVSGSQDLTVKLWGVPQTPEVS